MKDRMALRCAPYICVDGFKGHKTLDIFTIKEVADDWAAKAIKKWERRWFSRKIVNNLYEVLYKKKMVKYASCDLSIISDDSDLHWKLNYNHVILECSVDFACEMIAQSEGFTSVHDYPSAKLAVVNEFGFIRAEFRKGDKKLNRFVVRLILKPDRKENEDSF